MKIICIDKLCDSLRGAALELAPELDLAVAEGGAVTVDYTDIRPVLPSATLTGAIRGSVYLLDLRDPANLREPSAAPNLP